MSYLIGFLPWIAFAVLSAGNNPSRDQLILAAAVAFVLAVITSIPAAKKHLIGSLEVGGLVFFPIMIILSLFLDPLTVDKWAPALLGIGLAAAVGIGILVGRPFTLMYAKAQAPEVFWTNPYFIAMNKKLSTAWFIAFVVMAISSCIGATFNPTSTAALIFNWVVPIAVMVAVVFWQKGQIAKGRAAGQERAQARFDRVIEPGDRVIDFLDHVTARTDKASAEQTFNALASLGLVKAWKFADYGQFASGGIRLGDLNIELIGFDVEPGVPMPDEWVTFEPISLNGLLPELERRGIVHGELDTQKNGDMVIYTRVPLTDMENEEYATQLCTTFGPTRTMQPDAPKNKAGIVSVEEVRLRVSPAMNAKWQALAAPIVPGSNMDFGQGPKVTLVPADDDGIDALAVRVNDVDAAVGALTAAGLKIDGSTLSIGTLKLELVQL